MENMETWQIVLFVATLIYGIAFGVKNWFLRIKVFFNGYKLNQSDFGKILDAIFIVSVVYFCITFVKF